MHVSDWVPTLASAVGGGQITGRWVSLACPMKIATFPATPPSTRKYEPLLSFPVPFFPIPLEVGRRVRPRRHHAIPPTLEQNFRRILPLRSVLSRPIHPTLSLSLPVSSITAFFHLCACICLMFLDLYICNMFFFPTNFCFFPQFFCLLCCLFSLSVAHPFLPKIY